MWSMQVMPVAGSPPAAAGRRRVEVGHPAGVVGGARPAEEDRGAVRGGDRRQVRLGRSAAAWQHAARAGPRPGSLPRWGRRSPARSRTPRRRSECSGVHPVGPSVEQHPGAAVAPSSWTGFVRCCPVVRETQSGQGVGDRRRAVLVDGQLGERESAQPWQRSAARSARSAPARGRQPVQGQLAQRQQRPVRVDRGALRVGLPEHVVEDLERQRPGVAGGQHVPEEAPAGRTCPGRGTAGGAGSTAARPCPSTARRRAAGRTASRRECPRSRPGPSRGTGCGSCRCTARAPGGRRGARSPRTVRRC